MKKIAKDLINNKYLNVRFSLNETFPYGSALIDIVKECDSFTEFMLSPIYSRLTFTWCVLQSFLEQKDIMESVNKVDVKKIINSVSFHKINSEIYELEDLSKAVGIDFNVINAKNTIPNIEKSDVLFLYFMMQDRTEIERENEKNNIMCILNDYEKLTGKYIVLYDRSFKSNNVDILREDKNNIKELVTEFLQQNHSWSFLSGYNTEYGFTVLKKR
jgi:hypothetical protein